MAFALQLEAVAWGQLATKKLRLLSTAAHSGTVRPLGMASVRTAPSAALLPGPTWPAKPDCTRLPSDPPTSGRGIPRSTGAYVPHLPAANLHPCGGNSLPRPRPPAKCRPCLNAPPTATAQQPLLPGLLHYGQQELPDQLQLLLQAYASLKSLLYESGCPS